MSSAAPAAPPPRRSWSRRHRRAIDATVIVVAVLVVAEIVARILGPGLLPPRSDAAGEMAVKQQRMAEGGPTPIAFTGGSPMDAAVIPETVAAAGNLPVGFNAAVLGSRLTSQNLWMDEQVIPLLEPKVVVHEVNPIAVLPYDRTGVGDAALESTVIANVEALDDDLGHRIDHQLSSWSALVRYRGSLRDPVQVKNAIQHRLDGVDLTPKESTDDRWRNLLSPTGTLRQYHEPTSRELVPSGLEDLFAGWLAGDIRMQPLDRLIDDLRDRGVAPVIVIPPAARSAMAAAGVDVARYDHVNAEIRAHVQERGVPLIDLSSMALPDSAFFDAVHVDEEGARLVSTAIGEQLGELCRSGRVTCS